MKISRSREDISDCCREEHIRSSDGVVGVGGVRVYQETEVKKVVKGT